MRGITMSVTFEDFINGNPTCSKFRDNKDAKAIFDILNNKNNIMRMMEISEFEKPALSVCIAEIEEYYEKQTVPTINLEDDFTKKMIGRMVRTILLPYGYQVDKQKEIPKKYHSKYFSTASCYISMDDSDNLRMIINDDIMEVRKGNERFTNFHLQYTVTFDDDDYYHATAVSINGTRYTLQIPYEFRSQGNVHLIFLSEDSVWFCLSFDGHKGDMFVISNSIMKYVFKILNANEKSNQKWGNDISKDILYDIIKSYGESRA